jgi:hypothetical protein
MPFRESTSISFPKRKMMCAEWDFTFDHQAYLDVMDKHGIDVGVLSNTGGRIEKEGDRTKARELCEILNDSFAEAHGKYPRRFHQACLRHRRARPNPFRRRLSAWRGGQDDQFYPMTLKAMEDLDVPQADKEKIYYKNAQMLGF